MKNILLIGAILAVATGAAWAQPCDGCPMGAGAKPAEKVKAEEESLPAMVKRLEAGAAAGCEKSEAKLAAMCKAYGVKDVAALKEKVGKCGSSCGDKVEALSARVTKLAKGAENGCEKSKAKLAVLMQATRTDSTEKLLASIQGLESACGSCGLSVATLACLDAKLTGKKAPLSARATLAVSYAKKGCETSEEIVAELLVAASVKTTDELIKRISTLEASMTRGDKEAVAQLAKLDAAFPAPKAACDKSKKECGDCEDCGDCKDCKDCGDRKDCGSCPEAGPKG